MAVDISVVICAYTEARWDDLRAAVESVRQQTAPPLEIIVVIDYNAGLLQRARQALPDVGVVENRAEPGLSGARNTGISLAAGRVLAFLDDDARAQPDWLARLRLSYDDPQVIGVGGAIEPEWAAGRPVWFPEEFDWVVGCTYRGMPEQRAPVRNLIGANMSLLAEVFAEVGGFRSGMGRVQTLPAGCEETELCIRVGQRRPGAKLLYDPSARVTHLIPVARSNWAYFRARCYAEGQSKALVTRLVGSSTGLASERAYVLRTLPLGVWAALTGGNWAGLGRAAAMVIGLLLTTAGYLSGQVTQKIRVSPPQPIKPESRAALPR